MTSDSNEDLAHIDAEIERLLEMRRKIQETVSDLSSVQSPTWVPDKEQAQAMMDAQHNVLRFMFKRCPFYQRDFTSAEHKWVPYYQYPAGRWAVQSSQRVVSAPVLWYWPKEAWQACIKEMPDQILLMMGVFHG